MPMPPVISDPQQLLGEHSRSLIFRCVAGSQAYGTARAGSDQDIRGVFILPAAAYLTIEPPREQLSCETSDEVYYALRRFLELATSANPNLIELLYMPQECVLLSTPSWERLANARDLFLSKRAYESHVGYAMAQIKRARGQNKWINNPKPVEPPSKEEFCWFIPREQVDPERQPYRPIQLAQSGIDLSQCHVSAVEHMNGLYRLYHYGPAAKGVFHENMIVCQSIPQDEEKTRCIGLLIYNEQAYEKAMKDHQNYWTWRRNRNEARWVSQERGEIDYDAKNLMHTFRLIISAERIFSEGKPLVRFEGDDLQFLQSVRAGAFDYKHLMHMAGERIAHLAELRDKSPLPDDPDMNAIASLLNEITADWEAENA